MLGTSILKVSYCVIAKKSGFVGGIFPARGHTLLAFLLFCRRMFSRYTNTGIFREQNVSHIYAVIVQISPRLHTLYASVFAAIGRSSVYRGGQQRTGWCIAYTYVGVIRCCTPPVCPSVCLSCAYDLLENGKQ